MVRAARIARQNLDDESDDVVRTLSMCSMAGITVARLGVPREKNIVASLKIWTKQCVSKAKIVAKTIYSP
jgi:hypothetical protein